MIEFTLVNNFTLDGNVLPNTNANKVLTFVTAFLSGAVNHRANLGQADTLVIQGAESANDNIVVTDNDGAGGNLFEITDNFLGTDVTALGTQVGQRLADQHARWQRRGQRQRGQHRLDSHADHL